MKTTIRIEMSTNSMARNVDAIRRDVFGGRKINLSHNGGKTVLAEVSASEVSEIEALLDAAHSVRSYRVEE